MVKTKPPAAVGCASLDHPLRAAPSKMAGRDGETARLCRTEKLLVDHISRLRALGLGAAVINVLDREIELVFVALRAAKLGAAIGQHARQPDAVLIVKRHHPVIEDLGGCDWGLAVIELGKADFGIGVDHGLLIDPAHTLQRADIEGVLSAAITGAFALELAVRFLVGLSLLEGSNLGFGQQDAILRHLGFESLEA